jgi:hypothetical protein
MNMYQEAYKSYLSLWFVDVGQSVWAVPDDKHE